MCLFSFQAQSQAFIQRDSAYKIATTKDLTIKKSKVKKEDSYKGNHLSLYGALSLSQQIINDKGFAAPLNYLYNSVNNNAFKPGYSGGFRWDGKLNHSNWYSVILGVNRVSAGNYYKNKYSVAPFPEEFTHFKADNSFTTLSIAAHFKKILPVNKMDKYKFYLVVGPSIDYKISNISKENLMNGASNRSIINGDIGAEFDNRGYYVLFAHYKKGMNLMNSTVPVQLNRFEIGISIKAKDLF